MNSLSQAVHGKKVFPNSQPPAEHTKELFGVEYLHAQSGMNLSPTMVIPSSVGKDSVPTLQVKYLRTSGLHYAGKKQPL